MGALPPAAGGAFVDPQRRRAQQGSYSSPKADLQPTSPSGSQSRCREQDGSVVFVPATDCTPVVDSESWTPELSANGFVGIYHHWHHGAHDHQLCMFIVCQTYLPAACLEFADAVRDSGIAECTVGMVQASEVLPQAALPAPPRRVLTVTARGQEAHWLRTACARNQARIIEEVLSSFPKRYITRLPLVPLQPPSFAAPRRSAPRILRDSSPQLSLRWGSFDISMTSYAPPP